MSACWIFRSARRRSESARRAPRLRPSPHRPPLPKCLPQSHPSGRRRVLPTSRRRHAVCVRRPLPLHGPRSRQSRNRQPPRLRRRVVLWRPNRRRFGCTASEPLRSDHGNASRPLQDGRCAVSGPFRENGRLPSEPPRCRSWEPWASCFGPLPPAGRIPVWPGRTPGRQGAIGPPLREARTTWTGRGRQTTRLRWRPLERPLLPRSSRPLGSRIPRRRQLVPVRPHQGAPGGRHVKEAAGG